MVSESHGFVMDLRLFVVSDSFARLVIKSRFDEFCLGQAIVVPHSLVGGFCIYVQTNDILEMIEQRMARWQSL